MSEGAFNGWGVAYMYLSPLIAPINAVMGYSRVEAMTSRIKSQMHNKGLRFWRNGLGGICQHNGGAVQTAIYHVCGHASYSESL